MGLKYEINSFWNVNVWKFMIKRDALRDLVPFLQFKKSENHEFRSVTFNNTPP